METLKSNRLAEFISKNRPPDRDLSDKERKRTAPNEIEVTISWVECVQEYQVQYTPWVYNHKGLPVDVDTSKKVLEALGINPTSVNLPEQVVTMYIPEWIDSSEALFTTSCFLSEGQQMAQKCVRDLQKNGLL